MKNTIHGHGDGLFKFSVCIVVLVLFNRINWTEKTEEIYLKKTTFLRDNYLSQDDSFGKKFKMDFFDKNAQIFFAFVLKLQLIQLKKKNNFDCF